MLESLKFSHVRVLCVGDAMLDRFVTGRVERISPEGPVPVMEVSSETLAPGGAANVARNVAALGAQCTLVGATGYDANGALLAALLGETANISTMFIQLASRPTTCKTRFIGHHQQMLRVDHEDASALSREEEDLVLERALPLIPAHDVVILSDYAKGLLSGRVTQAVIHACNEAGRLVIVDPKVADLTRFAGATLVTPNQKETKAIVGIWPGSDEEAIRAGEGMLAAYPIHAVLMTRAEQGMTLMVRGEAAVHIGTEAREVFDVVGAGDTVIATLATMMGASASIEQAARVANTAAGIVIGKTGTATVSGAELRDAWTRKSAFDEKATKVIIRSWDEVCALAADWRADGLKVGFTNGCFDLLHVGHVRILQFARDHCDRLIVGINSDASVSRLKGPTRPINTAADRGELLASLSCVDGVVEFAQETPLELIRAISPDVLVKGAEYEIDKIAGADHVLGQGGQVLTFEMVPGKSTTATIKRSQIGKS